MFVRETRERITLESARGAEPHTTLGAAAIFRRVSWTHAPLRAVSQAGLVNNLNDGVSWGLFPLVFVERGLSLERTASLVAIYPAVWGIAQLFTGALSDRMGRRALMTAGMLLQGVALIVVAAGRSWGLWRTAMIALGLGTALVYPTLLSAVSDHSPPSWRATAIGVYRWWRDLGYVIGAILAGAVADQIGIPASIRWVGVLTIVSGLIVAVTYREGATPRTDTHAEVVPASARVMGRS